MLKAFYRAWYAPNNAILVIAGDVDPQRTVEQVKEIYGSIPSRPIATRPAVNLRPLRSDSFTLDSDLPYTVAYVAYRLPGSSDRDFAAAQILSDVLSSQRADLYGLVPAGKALFAGFDLVATYPKASLGFLVGALPPNGDPKAFVAEAKSIVAAYAKNGVPADLVDAAKRSEIAQSQFSRNSIGDLAETWSEALATEGRSSPDEDVEAIRNVTVDDVNRVLRTYVASANSVTAVLVPKPSGKAVASKGFGGTEHTTSAPKKPVVLPRVGPRPTRASRNPEVDAESDRRDAAQRRSAHRPTREREPHRHGGRSGAKQRTASNAARTRRGKRRARAALCVRLDVARPHRLPKGFGRHRCTGKRGHQLLAARAHGTFRPWRRAARR